MSGNNLTENVFIKSQSHVRTDHCWNCFYTEGYLILKNDNYMILFSTYENFSRHDGNWNGTIPGFPR